MTGVEWAAGKILGGAAKATASTLLKHRLKGNSQKSPVSKPEDCFWGGDGQLYCPVNTLPTHQNRTRVNTNQRFNVDPQPDITSTDFTPIEDRSWEQETYTSELDVNFKNSTPSEPFRTSTV